MNSQNKNTVHGEKKNYRFKDFWEWLIYGKGTVAEPWPSIEEVLAKKEVQREIQEIQKIFKTTNHKTKQSS